MSGFPAPKPTETNPPAPPKPDTVDESEEKVEETSVFDLRTYDRHWVDASSLQHFVQWIKIPDPKNPGRYIRWKKMLSDVPLILRDMGPPDGSIFDPKKVWEAEKPAYEAKMKALADAASGLQLEEDAVVLTEAEIAANKRAEEKETKKREAAEKKAAKAKAKSGKKSKEEMIADNIKDKQMSKHSVDIEKLSNNNSIETLLKADVKTVTGKLQRMLKMLDIAVNAKKNGKVGSSEEEVLDILWAIEEMEIFKAADEELTAEKEKKKEKKEKKEKKDKKDKKDKDDKKKKKDKKDEDDSPPLSENAVILKSLYDDKGTGYKDSLKIARGWMKDHKHDIIKFQMTKMHDRLPPLSRYNRKFKLEDWQCSVLSAVDNGRSTIVCAPTSSGKTLLSTYTCAKVGKSGTVLFVLPSEVLVWQIAATYTKFFSGNVTVCTESITFQEVGEGYSAQIYVGTPRALEVALTKARGCAGQEMMAQPQRESVVLDGGFDFEYLVLDEVHTLNGPEGDSLQRIIRATRCPILALSATIGNAVQLRDWFQEVRNEHLGIIEGEAVEQDDVLLAEHFARFINLQRYIVKENTSVIEGKAQTSFKLTKLHPVAAMTTERLAGDKALIGALSMTPSDMITLWEKLEKVFPDEIDQKDSPDAFFTALRESESGVDKEEKKVPPIKKRISLPQTKLYENRLKEILAELSVKNPASYEQLRSIFNPPPLKKIDSLDINEQLYGVIDELKSKKLLPAVAFQLSTFGAFQMFKTLLKSLEVAQNEAFPDHRKDLIKKAQISAAFKREAEGKGDRKNEKDDEEDAKAGLGDDTPQTEDIYQPHAQFVLSPPGNARLNSKEIEDVRNAMKKAGEEVDINHALIRGLRRGIAIYTNEVGFACYRRQVQILAQQGKIAVVFSDEALAYGVNMPFRSCVFCGDMGEALTPLIAQQMQGRAGRRGMDVQGNIVYLGMEWKTIENLMLGQISQVTGKNPHYPLIALQRALSASNDPDDMSFAHGKSTEKLESMTPQERASVKRWAKMSQVFENSCRAATRWQHRTPTLDEEGIIQCTNRTLAQFCGLPGVDSYYEVSKRMLVDLGYITVLDDEEAEEEGDEEGAMRLKMDHNILSMAWELSVEYLAESVNIVACLDTLYSHFVTNNRRTYKNEGDQNSFLACILQIVDRHPCPEGTVPLQVYIKARVEEGSSKQLDEKSNELVSDIEQDLQMFKAKVESFSCPDEEKQRLMLPMVGDYDSSVSDEDRLGPDFDSGVYEIIQTKRKSFPDECPTGRRNELKSRVYRLGCILRIMNNNVQQPHGKFKDLADYTNKCFSAVRYSIIDMMKQLTNQDDECEVGVAMAKEGPDDEGIY